MSLNQVVVCCSIFEELLKCYFSHVPRTADGTVCTPAQIAPAAVGSAHIAYYIIFNHDYGRDKPELTYNSCEGMEKFSSFQFEEKSLNLDTARMSGSNAYFMQLIRILLYRECQILHLSVFGWSRKPITIGKNSQKFVFR